jgi:hypothetical protein
VGSLELLNRFWVCARGVGDASMSHLYVDCHTQREFGHCLGVATSRIWFKSTREAANQNQISSLLQYTNSSFRNPNDLSETKSTVLNTMHFSLSLEVLLGRLRHDGCYRGHVSCM